MDFILANPIEGSNKVLFIEKDKYYIDIHDNLTFLPDDNFIWTSEKDGYNHIYLRNLNGSEEQITRGKWEITSFDGVDSDNMKIYYRSTEEGSINRTLYVQNLITKEKIKLSTEVGDNSVKFSQNFKYYMNSYSNAIKLLFILYIHQVENKSKSWKIILIF